MFDSFPRWLPELLSVNGEVHEIFERLYEAFVSSLSNANLTFDGLPVRYDNRVEEDGYEEGFWHLITKKYGSERILDTRRAERLLWCAAIINNSAEDEILRWDYQEAEGNVRTYLWLRDQDYLVILERSRRGDSYFIVTAFYIEGNSTRRNLTKKHEKRLK